jgi:hypothetical protein
MTTLSAVATSLRTAAAVSAIAAAATLMPAAVANAAPAAPLPQAGIGSSAGGDAVCSPLDPCTLAAPGSNSLIQNSLVWFGPANPNFQPLFGITFPNFFGVDFEGCLLGGAVHLSPYGGGFVGLGLGC